MTKYKLYLSNSVTQVNEFEISAERQAEIEAEAGGDMDVLEDLILAEGYAKAPLRRLERADGWFVDNSAWENGEVEIVEE